jgi:hypothetical protein
MNIFQLNKVLLEYNTSGNLTIIAGQGGDKASGKSFDNIAAGVTNPYKQENKPPTENEKRFPNLAKVVNQMKKDSVKGDKIVIGAALNELQQLVQTMNLRKDENGEFILPFGNNVRLTQKGNNFFIRMNNTAEDEKQTQQIDIMGEQLPII